MVVEFTSDHAAHQQKLLEMLRSGADSDIIVYKTREIISFGDPSHTLKLWRSGLYWWYIYATDRSGSPWLVTISMLHVFLEQQDASARSEARLAGLRLKLLRNKDRMSVATIIELCAMAQWILMLPIKLVVYTVYPERSFWKTNTVGILLSTVAVSAMPFHSIFFVLDKDRGKIFSLRPHQPMDVCALTSGGIGYANGVAAQARFNKPCAMTTLGGTILVLDGGNGVVRLVHPRKPIPISLGLFTVHSSRKPKKAKSSTSTDVATPRKSKTPEVCTITDSTGEDFKFAGAVAICTAADESAVAYVATADQLWVLKNIYATDDDGKLTCTAELDQFGDAVPAEFRPLQAICDSGIGFLVVSAYKALLRYSIEERTFELLTRAVGQPRGLAVWNKTHLIIADSETSQLLRLPLRDVRAGAVLSCEKWAGQERDSSTSDPSADGTSANATFLWPRDIATFGNTVIVAEYGKIRLLSSIEPLGRALSEMQKLVEVTNLSPGLKGSSTFNDGEVVFQSMNDFQDGCSEVRPLFSKQLKMKCIISCIC